MQKPESLGIPPALLGDATWYGTLAAVRDLGAHDVAITLASHAPMAPARWSRHVKSTVTCPRTGDPAAFMRWLLRFGETQPRHVLYPTSDESAWLFSSNARELSRWFYLYSPPIASLLKLLDKGELARVARAAGLQTPETRIATDERDVERIGRELGFPLYVKARMQVLAHGFGKGIRVERSSELLAAWRKLRDSAHFAVQVRERVPDVTLPVIQTCTDKPERIYTVDGFIDETGELYASLACVKLLQRPRGSGPGIIFVDAEVDPAIDVGLRELCKTTGFYGVFDAEFIEQGGRKLLIDLNPRFYNHMAFETERGLHLPWLAYLAAIGDDVRLRRAVRLAGLHRPAEPRAYVHRFPTSLMLTMQTLSGGMTAAERRCFRQVIEEHNGRITDPAVQSDDPLPGLAEVLMELMTFGRHPRSFLRQLAKGGSEPGFRAS